MQNSSAAQIFGFMLTEQFSMIAFAAALEPLRLANRATGRKLYEWRLFSADGKSAEASNGARINVDGRFRDAQDMDAVVVCSGVNVQQLDHRDLIAVVRRLVKFGAAPGAVCTGAYVLAKAGLLDGHRCTIHWENRPGIQADFPELEVGEDLFEVDGDRFTCAGGVAAADMMLSLIKRDHGEEVAALVTDQLILHRVREASERQRMDMRTRLGVADPKLLRALALMHERPAHPWSVATLAQASYLSRTIFSERFRTLVGVTPMHYLGSYRMTLAAEKLKNRQLSLHQVAESVGYASEKAFSRAFQRWTGLTPSAYARRHGAA